jgi:hypothetical protein
MGFDLVAVDLAHPEVMITLLMHVKAQAAISRPFTKSTEAGKPAGLRRFGRVAFDYHHYPLRWVATHRAMRQDAIASRLLAFSFT